MGVGDALSVSIYTYSGRIILYKNMVKQSINFEIYGIHRCPKTKIFAGNIMKCTFMFGKCPNCMTCALINNIISAICGTGCGVGGLCMRPGLCLCATGQISPTCGGTSDITDRSGSKGGC